MLDARTLTVTPDPYGLLNLDGLRLPLADAERRDRRAPAPLLLSIRDERCVQPLLMASNPVCDLHRAHPAFNPVEEYEQRTKLG